MGSKKRSSRSSRKASRRHGSSIPELSTSSLNRVQRDWERVAKEPMELEWIKGALYGFGSELAVLRLFHHYRRSPNARAQYSGNRRSWVFSLE